MYAKLKQLYPNADFTSDIILQDDGDGVYIAKWNEEKLGKEPTIEEIEAVVIPSKTTLELDTEKYLRRADSKNLLMAEMAAMNVSRIKNGTWTVAQLTALMQDEQIKALIAHMETLSFELAIGVIQGLTNPLIKPEIKSAWTARLVAKL